MPPTSPMGRPPGFGFDFLRDQLKVRRAVKGKLTLLAPWSARTSRSSRPIRWSSAATSSPWSTRPITSSSTRPARRWSSAVPPDRLRGGASDLPLGRPARPESSLRGSDFALDEKSQQVELTPQGDSGSAGQGLRRAGRHRPWRSSANMWNGQCRPTTACGETSTTWPRTTRSRSSTRAPGRRMPGRQWGDGLHQAVEAKEGVTIYPRGGATPPRSPTRATSGSTRNWPA